MYMAPYKEVGTENIKYVLTVMYDTGLAIEYFNSPTTPEDFHILAMEQENEAIERRILKNAQKQAMVQVQPDDKIYR
jgi:hypothetical protein